MLSNLVSETTKQDPSCNKVEFHLPTHFPPCGSPWVPRRRDARVWLLSQLFTSETMTVNKFCSQHKPALCPVWDRSPLLKKQIFTSAFHSGFIMKFLFLWSLLLSFFLRSHIFQVVVFFRPFISESSPLLYFSSPPSPLFLFILAWDIFILSNPRPFAKTLTFRSFSNLEPNCANNSLRQLEPYMVLCPGSGCRP